MLQVDLMTPCLALTLAFLPFTGCKPAGSSPAPPVWRYAVVFHLSGGKASYAGVADVSSVSGALEQLLNAAPAPNEASKSILSAPPSDDDIWLEGNGCSAEVVWNPGAQTCSVVQNGRMTRPLEDGGVLKPVVAAIQPFLAPAGFGKNAASPSAAATIGTYSAPPRTLVEMVREAPVVVLGRVVAVLREQHMPQNYAGAAESTVFLVAVERYFRGAGVQAPSVVKVMNNGGDLPWVNAALGTRGIGERDEDEPLLKPGARYIMFLQLIGERGRGLFALLALRMP
ncbi:MAG: hypothetical protein KGJ62_12470 [Armatimonadetes bacterium]|nr:hypothetical protein [Armatimonadota bacterium]MDE2207921.1 hypothetical protein [Armatimonadota bacterium]